MNEMALAHWGAVAPNKNNVECIIGACIHNYLEPTMTRQVSVEFLSLFEDTACR
jgi:hypothetical protein